MPVPIKNTMANKMLNDVFRKGKRVSGSGRYTETLGESKSGPCKFCKSQAGRHNINGGSRATPPYHPNCKCSIQ